MKKRQSSAQLLQTKLHLPAGGSAIARPRLFQKLDAALESKLTLIAAPAGFGKTTLVARWLSGLSRELVDYVWLALDEADNDLARFLSYVIAAFQKIDPYIGRGLQDALHTPEPPDAEAVLTALVNDIIALAEESPPRQIILALDDYHALDNPQIDSATAFLLDYLPAHVHLMIISRIDPTLPLSRLRARRQITEIREHDLRFTPHEASLFLQETMGLALPISEINQLCTRTEGWIAGLQLAAIAIQTAPDNRLVTALSGTHRYIMDYLTDEVFQRQPPDIQRFLLESSVLDRMCADLCDILRQSGDSQFFLEKLEQMNLFIVPLDDERRWYRYHHLFADLLRQRLRQMMPESFAELHHRASTWYATYALSSGDEAAIDEAIHHAVATSDSVQVALLLEQFGDSVWERGEHDKLRRWLGLLPPDILAEHPKLGIFQGWLAFTSGQSDGAENSLGQAERNPLSDELRGRIAATRAFIATFKGDTPSITQWAQKAVNLLTDVRSTWSSSAAIALGDAYSLGGNPITAGEAYQSALAKSRAAGNVYLSLNAGFKLAGTQRQRGLLRQAYDTCSQQIALAEQTGLAQTTMAGCLYALRGDILCEWNQVAEALAQTQQAMDTSIHVRHIGFTGWIHLYRTRCLLVARDFEGAEAVIARIEKLGQTTPLPPWIASPFAALRALLWLAKGDTRAALVWVAERQLSVDDEIIPSREFEYLTLARILAVQGQLAVAQSLLERLLNANRTYQRVSIDLIILIILTLLLQAQGKTDEALQTFSEALRLGEPGHFTRTFLDSSPALLPLLKLAMVRGVTPEYAQQLIDALSAASPPPTTSPDALSEREREVLRLIASGLKNQEIADQLVISLNTVLYHTKNIYSKLGVTHRTQAVQRARELELI
ncbi:MAG: LuxR C-terminal-related transcriptional regulator [Anaerolineae bacterium]|nr:LuxR C-terminal-related transcriptional regulator [Anaerolineae bacterium]